LARKSRGFSKRFSHVGVEFLIRATTPKGWPGALFDGTTMRGEWSAARVVAASALSRQMAAFEALGAGLIQYPARVTLSKPKQPCYSLMVNK